MNSYEKQDMQAFLIEAELIHQKVKKLANNEISTQQFDKIQAQRTQDLRKRQRAKQRRAQQALNKKKQGREGKGITKDFSHFCRFCHRQYQLPTPVCLRCKRDTMTLQQRQKMLGIMVEDYKDKKKKRQQRKMKWQMWQKTKAMLWKKTSNNYDKWQYFVSDSQQQPQQQPILPKNDPNFKAMEMDMEQRKKKRKQDTQKAQKLKQKGNASMKQGDYQKAMQYYTLALQHIRDIKSIYTNRALAYIKLGKFKKAISDCTNVIEYMQVFQKVGQNLDLTFKAYSRRALAHKERKDYKQALQDVNKGLGIYPNDKNVLILKKQIQGFIEHTEKVKKLMDQNKKVQQVDKKQQSKQQQNKQQNIPTQEDAMVEEKQIIKQLAEQQLKQEEKNKQQQQKALPPQQLLKQQPKQNINPIQDIKQKTQNLTRPNIEYLIRKFYQQQDLITIFIAAKGITKSLTQLIQTQQCNRQGYLVSKCLRNDGVGQKQVWDFGISKLHNRISQLLSANSQLNLSKYFILQDMFQAIIPLSLHEKYRGLLNNSVQTHKFVQKTFSQLITKHKKQSELFSSFLIYLGNLCCGQSKLRDNFINENIFKIILSSLFEKVIIRATFNRSYQDLKKNSYSLFTNLIQNQNHRNKFIQFFNDKDQATGKPKWQKLIQEVKLYLRRNDNFSQYMEALLSVFVNAAYGNPIQIDGLAQVLNDRFFVNPTNYSPQTLHRSLLIVSRLKYKNSEGFSKILKTFSNNLNTFKKIKLDKDPMQHIVRILNIMYKQIGGKKYQSPLPQNILKQIKSYLSIQQKNEILFCNSANLFCLLLQIPSNYKQILYKELKPIMKDLITIAKDRVGNYRKNSAILLAKLSISEQCKEQLKKHHGMDVLMSIAKFVK